ncbi:MAG: class I SAM-dependent methyltransferase [Nitrososphaerales archaeon]|nr:class I SAM-dependent methyltransferase [Nitrososphaerales archaeon]
MKTHPSIRLAKIGMSKGMRVADLGAGKGLFTLAAAGVVGPDGLVYSVEPDTSRAALIERRLLAERLANVRVLVTGAERLADIPDSTIDIAFSLNSIHHFRDRTAAFAEAKRILKLGGRFYVRDIVRSWLTRHGTRREDVTALSSSGFSDRRIKMSSWTLEATFTK